MSFRGKVWFVLAILLAAFWWLAFNAYRLVIELLERVLS